MQPRALAAAVEAADAAAAAEAELRAAQAAAPRVPAAVVFGGAAAGGGGGGAAAPRAAAPPRTDRIPAEIRAALEAMVRGPAGVRAPDGGANLLAFLEQRRAAGGPDAAMRAALAVAHGGGGGGGGGVAALEVRDARGLDAAAARDFAAVFAARDDEDDMSDDDDDDDEEEGAAAAAAAATAAAAGAAARAADAAPPRGRRSPRRRRCRRGGQRSRPSRPLLAAAPRGPQPLRERPHVPAALSAKAGRSLRFLDLSGNGGLRFPAPLVPGALSSLPALRALDARGAHAEAGLGYWSADKCASMRHLCALARAGKRRRPWRLQVFMDKE